MTAVALTVVVVLPAEIDLVNDTQVAGMLLAAVNAGAMLVVADMGATTFCSVSAVREILAAGRAADEAGAVIRLAGLRRGPRRVFTLMGARDAPGICYPAGADAFAPPASRENSRASQLTPAKGRRATPMRHDNTIARAATHGLGAIDTTELATAMGDDLTWKRPAGATSTGGGMIEVAAQAGFILIRDSDTRAPCLVFDRSRWEQLVQGVKSGEYDNLPVTVT